VPKIPVFTNYWVGVGQINETLLSTMQFQFVDSKPTDKVKLAVFFSGAVIIFFQARLAQSTLPPLEKLACMPTHRMQLHGMSYRHPGPTAIFPPPKSRGMADAPLSPFLPPPLDCRTG